jgi:hypothetical protein
MIILDGRSRKQRRLVVVRGREVWLRQRSFDALSALVRAATESPDGCASVDELGGLDSYHQVIHRLRRDFAAAGIDPAGLIENVRPKRYRLITRSGLSGQQAPRRPA